MKKVSRELRREAWLLLEVEVLKGIEGVVPSGKCVVRKTEQEA